MNEILKKLAPRALALLLAFSLTGLVGCSSGTKSGDTNVEEGSSKDKDPANQDEPGQNTNNQIDTHQDTIDALQDTAKVKNDAYERSKKTSHTDKPNLQN